jgi:hypothetical protein
LLPRARETLADRGFAVMSIAVRAPDVGQLREVRPGDVASSQANKAVGRVGFWSAVVAAVSTVGYSIAQPLTSPTVEWHGMTPYAASFNPSSQLFFYFTTVLAVAFVVLMTSIHYAMPESRRLWTHLGLIFSVIYATIVSMNYVLQLVGVGPSISSGDTEGVAFFVPTNPHGFFLSSELLGYVFMILALLFAAPAFYGSALELWIRWMFVASFALSAAVIPVGSVLGLGLVMVGTISTDIWEVLLTVALILVAVFFRRRLRTA